MTPTAKQRVKVTNRLGLHARPAMLLAETAQRFGGDVTVQRADQDTGVDAKSIMQIMMLAATAGTELIIAATGDDAVEAVKELAALVAAGFDED
jgi:phosphotransferase system HPr (HPr) family protein